MSADVRDAARIREARSRAHRAGDHSLCIRDCSRAEHDRTPSPQAAMRAAMLTHRPACAGDDRFVADEHTPAETAELLHLCGGCPLIVECAALAKHLRPKAGFWAGRVYGHGRPGSPTPTPRRGT